MARGLFVYGSLRSGEYNQHLIRPFVQEVSPARIRGMDLYPVTSAYPGMVRGEGSVVGEYVQIRPAAWLDALTALDELEDYYGPGHPENHYERVLLPVETESGIRLAYTYLWVRGVADLDPLPGGDWVAYRR
ncbi:MAG: gamma-glutamylcyclotransferase family protein [Bacillota bacterium]